MADDARDARAAGEAIQVIPLWPGGPPGPARESRPEAWFRQTAAGGRETRMLRNVSEPALSVFAPAPGAANGAGLIICPGGGWRILAWEHEGEDMARRLAARGFTAFVLKYRLLHTPTGAAAFVARAAATAAQLAQRLAARPPEAVFAGLVSDETVKEGRRIAAEDGRRALALVRERAPDWGLDAARIGMAGFSAGAFLTMDVVMDPGGPPLAFAAPIYGGDTGGRPVPADAPPLFAAVAQDDALFVQASQALLAQWTQAGRPAELHVFARGGHGFGLERQGLPADRWIDLFEAWLGDLGLAR
jgi:acetyl esterase/lipase